MAKSNDLQSNTTDYVANMSNSDPDDEDEIGIEDEEPNQEDLESEMERNSDILTVFDKGDILAIIY